MRRHSEASALLERKETNGDSTLSPTRSASAPCFKRENFTDSTHLDRVSIRLGDQACRPASESSSELEVSSERADSDNGSKEILSLEGLWENWFLKPVAWAPESEPWQSKQVLTKRRLSLRHGASSEEVDHYVTRLGKSFRKQIRGQETTWTPLTFTLKESFRVLSVLGTGHYGIVLLCEEKETGQKFACKTVFKSVLVTESVVRELCNEVSTMLKLQQSTKASADQKHLVHLHEVIDDENAVHLIMDYCDGGDLFHFISSKKRLSESTSASILLQLVTAVSYMHSLGILHRDLKPENIFLTTTETGLPHAKLGDFGLCVNLQGGRKAWGIIGTFQYMAPEVVNQEYYSHKADIWSLGSMLFACLSGHEPFPQKDEKEMFHAMSRGVPTFREKAWRDVSPSALDLVMRMLNPDPLQRVSLTGILAHPWLQAHDEIKQVKTSLESCSQAMTGQLGVEVKGEHAPQQVVV